MRVVLDTNVLISGIFWKGASYEILQKWKENVFMMITSIDIILEFRQVMKGFKIQLPEKIVQEWVRLITLESTLVNPTKKISLITDDPADNKFLEAAVAGDATYIVSQDKHLLKIKRFDKVQIVTPQEFLHKTEK
jgi:uncharacterized protein